MNDLRNRYLLTKGSTQKMVNNALGQFLLIHSRLLSSLSASTMLSHRRLSSSQCQPIFVCGQFCLHGSVLARTRKPSLASADLPCLI